MIPSPPHGGEGIFFSQAIRFRRVVFIDRFRGRVPVAKGFLSNHSAAPLAGDTTLLRLSGTNGPFKPRTIAGSRS